MTFLPKFPLRMERILNMLMKSNYSVLLCPRICDGIRIAIISANEVIELQFFSFGQSCRQQYGNFDDLSDFTPDLYPHHLRRGKRRF